MSKRLLGHSVIKGIIRCDSGLSIGVSKETLEIGGLDNPVIKNPLTGLPYIPGSSIKGKLRSLLELKYGKYGQDGSPYTGKDSAGAEDTQCPISRVFGPHRNTSHSFGPTRIIVRDANLTPEWETKLSERRQQLGTIFLEVKQENSIDRKIGIAKGGLRTQERVPEGTEFAFEIVIRNFDWGFHDEVNGNLTIVKEAMNLLTKEYLGGSGSRGYGKVSFIEVKLNGEPYDITC